MADQDRIIQEFRLRSAQAATLYRSACLALLVCTVALYLLPVPAYLAGTHASQTHLHLFHGSGQESVPSFPWYLTLGAIQISVLAGMVRELADLLHITPAFAATDSPRGEYGTAPQVLADWLSTLLWPGSERRPLTSTCPPRVVYCAFCAGLSFLPPLVSLPSHGVASALWWFVGSLSACFCAWSEYSIARSESEVGGLTKIKYTYTSL